MLRRASVLLASLALFLQGTSAGLAAPSFQDDPEQSRAREEALELLAGHVDRLVKTDVVVGAVLHVIRERRTVLLRSFGWADREEGRPMQTDGIFCVRSMTKPLVGTAVQMMIDEGKLALDTRAAEILPAFDRPDTRAITIEHLLTHTSGLPLTALERPLHTYGSLEDVAAEAAEHGITGESGAQFQYSDAGTDTLGAIVARVAGVPLEKFLEERLLEPLGMSDTLTLLDPEDPRGARVPSAYSGNEGAWIRHWSRNGDAIFPLFLGSQALYSTTSDYARFLQLWMDGGVAGDRRLLSSDAIGRALAPGHAYPLSGGFTGLVTSYAQLWTVHHATGDLSPVVFGHAGSDGTYGWAWPKLDLIVLFFTQSRGSMSGLELERVIDQLLVREDVEGFRSSHENPEPQAEIAHAEASGYDGLYWDEDIERAYYVVRQEGDRLNVERPGRFRLALGSMEESGSFGSSAVQVIFERDSSGVWEAFRMKTRTREERQVRHRPDPDLPSPEQIEADVRAAYGLDKLRGAVRLRGTIETAGGKKGPIEYVFDATRSRLMMNLGGESETEMVYLVEGDRAFMRTGNGELQELDGVLRDQELAAHPTILYGGWNRRSRATEVLRRIGDDEAPRWLVRIEPEGLPGSSALVDARTALIVGEDRIELLRGMGWVGLEVSYGDFRTVGEMTLPFHIAWKFASSLIGEMNVRYEQVELLEGTEGLFEDARR